MAKETGDKRRKERRAKQRRAGDRRRTDRRKTDRRTLGIETDAGDFIARQVLDKDLRMFEG